MLAQLRAEQHRSEGRGLRKYCLAGVAISYPLFGALLLFHIYWVEIDKRWPISDAVGYWMAFGLILLAGTSLAFTILSVIAFIMPTMRMDDDGKPERSHRPLTVAQCRAQRRRWGGIQLRAYCIRGGVISYVLFWALLLFNICSPQIQEHYSTWTTTWMWILFTAIFAGLIWFAFAVTSLVNFVAPAMRKTMFLPFAMHLVFALLVTPGIVCYVEVFQTAWAPAKPTPIPDPILIPPPTTMPSTP